MAETTHRETTHLTVRPFTVADAGGAFAWFGDAEVMKFIVGGPDRSVEDTRARLARYIAHQAQHGFSKWLIREKGTGRSIGDAGLLMLESVGCAPDLGFRLLKSHWGRGFATEVATLWLRIAFQELRLAQVSAFAHVENLRSLRALDRIGFRRCKREFVMGMDSYTYVLSNEEFSRALLRSNSGRGTAERNL